MHTTEIIDEYAGFPDDGPVCVQLFVYSEGIYFLCYGLFWIPAGQLLAMACRRSSSFKIKYLQRYEKLESPFRDGDDDDDTSSYNVENNDVDKEIFWGLSNTLAATLIPWTQWTIGFSFIFYVVAIALTLNIDAVLLYKMVFGALVYHYGNLITFYFAHNLSYTLADGDDDDKNNNDNLKDCSDDDSIIKNEDGQYDDNSIHSTESKRLL